MRTFLKAYWKDIVMINYEVPAEVLLPYLPYGTELDDFEGRHYVSLVGFQFLHSALFKVPIPVYGSFDEVNLRFYVKRKLGTETRRGVVFINEIVPYKVVAWLANKLYKEHYTSALMQSKTELTQDRKSLEYQWQQGQQSFGFKARFSRLEKAMSKGSHEEFIYEHYYGYTRVRDDESWEYRVNHEPWKVNSHLELELQVAFDQLYGKDFAFLNQQPVHSVYNACGSWVSIDRKITRLKHESR